MKWEACSARAAKPEGWIRSRYPLCNRPSHQKPPHREYDAKTAKIRYEWWEAIDLSDRDLRYAYLRASRAERKARFGK